MFRSRNKHTVHSAERCEALRVSQVFGKRHAIFIAATLLTIVAAAYHNILQCPFIFDDIYSIEENMSIRELRTALTPDLKIGETASGRPILNFTFAINYKISGLDVWSYHAGNLLIHFLAGLTLFGIVRRTLLLPVFRHRFSAPATMLSGLIAAIWLVHPLATESVTYIVQRAESLMALFYLITIYCFIRAVTTGTDQVICGHISETPISKKPKTENGNSTLWLMFSVICCALGMGTKEVMVSAPLMVALYDAAFVSGSFRQAMRQRWRWHGALALTWIPLVLLMTGTGSRGATVGFTADPEVTWWPYALTQCWAFVHYLQLAFVPHPLVFDYGLTLYTNLAQIWWQILFVMVFVTLCFALYLKRPCAGWLGLFYLAVLAPTTTIIPVTTQVIAEHRVYLALTAIVTAVVLIGYHYFAQRVFWIGLAVITLFASMTYQHNKVYGSDNSIWMDVVKKYPLNARANGNVGNMYVRDGRVGEALPYLRKAIELHPSRGDHYNNLGHAYAKMGDFENAALYYEQANGRKVFRVDIFYINYCQALMKLNRFDEAMTIGRRLVGMYPNSTPGWVIMGNVHRARNELSAAEDCFRRGLAIDDKLAEAWNNWGNVKALQGGKLEEALEYYKKAAVLAPSNAEIQDNAARLLAQLERWHEAIPYFEAELLINSDDNNVRLSYADALYASKRYNEAATQFKKVLQNDSSMQQHVGRQMTALMSSGDYASALFIAQALVDAAPENSLNVFLFANILVALERYDESLQHYHAAILLNPAQLAARYNYATALVLCGRHAEAAAQYEEAIKLAPNEAIIRHSYAGALEKLGRIPEAIAQERDALRLQAGLQEARQNLDRLMNLPSAAK